jgi:hypothetical protein
MAHAADARDLVAKHASVFLHVGDARFQQIVEPAGDHVALDDLVRGQHGVLEALKDVCRRVIERDLSEGEQLLAEEARIEPREIAFDESVALQAADALDARRKREIDGAGELRDGEPPIGLQQREELAVDPIQLAAGTLGSNSVLSCQMLCFWEIKLTASG